MSAERISVFCVYLSVFDNATRRYVCTPTTYNTLVHIVCATRAKEIKLQFPLVGWLVGLYFVVVTLCCDFVVTVFVLRFNAVFAF